MEEHKRSVIGNHVREQHGNKPCEIAKNFRVLRKCSNKFDCLIFEMFFIRDLKPKLNKQSDSIRAKLLFNTSNSFYSFHFLFILHFPIPLFLLFVCKYLAFYFSFHCFRNCTDISGIFIHELELENDRGAVETSFLFLIACFYKIVEVPTVFPLLSRYAPFASRYPHCSLSLPPHPSFATALTDRSGAI